jgi:hypothetical protein
MLSRLLLPIALCMQQLCVLFRNAAALCYVCVCNIVVLQEIEPEADSIIREALSLVVMLLCALCKAWKVAE